MRKFNLLLVVFSIVLLGSCGNNGENNKSTELKTELDSVGYAIGANIGMNLERDKLTDMNVDIIAKGIKDAIAKDSSIMAQKDIQKVLQVFFNKKRIKDQQEKQKQDSIAFKANIEEGRKFLAEKEKEEGVQKTPSGLMYKVIKKGTGTTPKATDMVKVNYKGTLIDGTEFDSSFKRGEPSIFTVNRLIKGWTEALQMMKVGAKWELYITHDLAYGNRQTGQLIKPFSTLVFEMELLSIEKQETK